MSEGAKLLALRARWVFPVAGPPIAGGVVTVAGSRIVDVGTQSPGGPVHDLGDVALLPGLVNAHVHLEFSSLAAPLGVPGMALPRWIGEVRGYRETAGDYVAAAVSSGVRESLAGGAIALGEIITSDWREAAALPADTWPTIQLFREAIAPLAERVDWSLGITRDFLDVRADTALLRPALSPHAPYTVHPRLLAGLIDLSRARHLPVAMHVAESREELEFLRSGSGPFRELFERIGVWDPSPEARYPRVLDYLQALSKAARALAVHGNFLDEAEIRFLAENCGHMSVVYCGRTHNFFRHEPYPLAQMLAAGVQVGLGTDGRSSNPDLNMLEEMKFVAGRHPGVPPERILELATRGGAKALGLEDALGTLAPGKEASLAVVAIGAANTADPHDLLFEPASRITQTWLRGNLYQPS